MLNEIKNVLKDEFEISGNNKRYLIEKLNNRIISKVSISISGQYLLYKFEKNGQIQIPYFKDTKDVKKIADFVLFTIKEGTLFILIFELKNGNGNPYKQLVATKILVEYFIETIKRISKVSLNKIEFRKIAITNKAVKTPTRISKIYSKNNFTKISSKSSINISLLCN